MFRSTFIPVLLILTGCRFGFEAADPGPADASLVDLGLAGANDSGSPVQDDAGPVDLGFDVGVDAGDPSDAGPPDLGLPDAGPPDLGNNCPPPNADTVALFEFDKTMTTSIADTTGTQTGSVRSTFKGGNLAYVPGPPGCGTAAAGFDRNEAHVEFADIPEWQLNSGAVEFWMLLEDAPSGRGEGIIGRDEFGNDNGHFSVMLGCGGELVVRFQDPMFNVFRCSSGPIDVNRWQHVGINFGSPDLDAYLDGIPLTGTQTISYGQGCNNVGTCSNEVWTDGISGNSVRFIIGGTKFTTPDSLPEVQGHWRGAIDHVAIHRRRQLFIR